MPAFEIGYVLANQESDGLKYASVYSKNYPQVEILFEQYDVYDEGLKPGCAIKFRKPENYEPGTCLNPEYNEVTFVEDSPQTVSCKKRTKYSQISYVTDAIFTTNPDHDPALELPEVHAIGFSLEFGRIIVNDDFDKSVEISEGKKFKIAVRRYLKRGTLPKFETYGTILICERVLDVNEDDFKQINYLQRKCPWSKHLDNVKSLSTPNKSDTSAVKTRPKSNKDAFFEENCGFIIPFGLVVERTQDSVLVFSSLHQEFYRIDSKFDLKVAQVYFLKLSHELDGVYQKCAINEEFFNFDAQTRVIAPEVIEATFEVELCESSNSAFPSPWANIYGETQNLGKVLIPDTENLPPIGSLLKIRAIFMNKPVEDYCWIFAGQIGLSREATKKVDNKSTVSTNEPTTSKVENVPTVFAAKFHDEGIEYDAEALEFADDNLDEAVEPISPEQSDNAKASTSSLENYDEPIICARSRKAFVSKPQMSDGESNKESADDSDDEYLNSVRKFSEENPIKPQNDMSREEDDYVNDSDDEPCGMGFGEEDALDGAAIIEQNAPVDQNDDFNYDKFLSDDSVGPIKTNVFDQEEQKNENSSDQSELDENETYKFGIGEEYDEGKEEPISDTVNLNENQMDQDTVYFSDDENNCVSEACYEDVTNNPVKYGLLTANSYDNDDESPRTASVISGGLMSNCSLQIDDEPKISTNESEDEEPQTIRMNMPKESKRESSSSGSFEKVENEPLNVPQTQPSVQPKAVSPNNFSTNKAIRVKRNVYKEANTVTADSDSDASSNGNF